MVFPEQMRIIVRYISVIILEILTWLQTGSS